ncbi:MAG: ABC transporter permease, partial [Roseivivax sp.]|nr:ABC transporter permease [Roseivivax sp.]
MSEAKQPMLAADGRPLKRSLSRALRMQKIRALALIAPLLIFVLVTFIAPIADMLFRSVENQIVSETMPTSTALLADWDGQGVPGEDVFAAAYEDMAVAAQRKELTRLGSRLNYEMTGASSLFRKLNRGLEDVGELYLKQFKKHDKAWDKAETWASLLGEPAWLAEQEAWKKGESQPEFVLRDGMAELLPRTVQAYQKFADFEQGVEGKSLVKEEPWPIVHTALYQDLKSQDVSGYTGPQADMLKAAATLVASPDFETTTFSEAFKEIDKDWLKPEIWQTIQTFSPKYTSGYFLNAVDMQLTPDGIEVRNERQRIYMLLFQRTIIMSLAITLSCILLAYPVSYLLSNLPMRKANLLMILVLLPFWTSLLVRTSAWKVMLQQQGVINDTLVWLGLVADDNRLVMINNQLGTIIAMTH